MKKPYLIALILTLPTVSIFGQNETLYPWTDVQGRTLQASFISLDQASQTVIIKWNGKIFPLPINTLSASSQVLARQLGQVAIPPAPVAPAPVAPAPVAPAPVETVSSNSFDEFVAAIPTDTLGPEALDIDHDWTSADGRSLSARFVSLVGDQLTLSINGGTREMAIPMNKFSADSQALAKVLQAVAKKHRPAPTQPPASQPKSKPAQVSPPKLEEEDLDKTHTWTSSDGRSLQASFVSADANEVALKMKGRSTPMNLAWSKLDAQSVALGKALQALKKSLIPTVFGGTEKMLERYGSGKWKNYNTYFESVAFEAGLSANGTTVHVWLLDDEGKRITRKIPPTEDSKTPTEVTLPPMSISFFPVNTYDEENGRKHWNPLRVTKLSDSPPVSNDRKSTTIKGEWENGAKFEYNFEMTHTGLSFWGDADEPSSTKYPGIIDIRIRAPQVLDAAKAETVKQINDAAGDGALYVDPLEGKRLKFPFNEKWTDIKSRLTKGGKKTVSYNPIKYAEFKGTPLGEHKIKIAPSNTRSGHLTWDDGYSQVYPIQGAYLNFTSVDGAEARKSTTPKEFKKRLEIKKSERVKVTVIRGAG